MFFFCPSQNFVTAKFRASSQPVNGQLEESVQQSVEENEVLNALDASKLPLWSPSSPSLPQIIGVSARVGTYLHLKYIITVTVAHAPMGPRAFNMTIDGSLASFRAPLCLSSCTFPPPQSTVTPDPYTSLPCWGAGGVGVPLSERGFFFWSECMQVVDYHSQNRRIIQ